MRHGNMTQAQAIEVAGDAIVKKLDAKNCEMTGRLQTDGDDAVEFSAAVTFTHPNDGECVLVAYYYQSPEDLKNAGDDLGNCDWVLSGYEVR